MIFHCCDERRLEVLRRSGSANAIEFLEVQDREAASGLRQRTLFVRLLRPGFTLGVDNLRIDGGERIPTVAIEWAAPGDALPAGVPASLVAGLDELPRTLVVRTRAAGDFSRYTLHLVVAAGSEAAPAGFDPRLASIAFSFKVECPSDFDCAAQTPCPPEPLVAPDIDYLARDYEGFRRLMLDRLSALGQTPGRPKFDPPPRGATIAGDGLGASSLPSWTERSAADLGVTLVELLAYAADNLAYRQDAIANEAYLGTARQRISVRRHARLVDYALHEGCNARAWVQCQVVGSGVALNKGTQLLTRVPGLPTELPPGSPAWLAAFRARPQVFELAHAALLDEALNALPFYTWGDAACCLVRGATSATLRGHPPLRVGDVLVLEELLSPGTFTAADADPSHRWAVRLTAVTPSSDPSGQLFDTPPVDAALDITEIAWDGADALPFSLCLSVAERPGLVVSVARGNVLLVDHGQTLPAEALPGVPAPRLASAPPPAMAGSCAHPAPQTLPLRYRPRLAQGPLTHGFDLAAQLAVPPGDEEAWWPAALLGDITPREAVPQIALAGQLGSVVTHWLPRRDLLGSGASATDFVVEVDDAARAVLRFGDDAHGQRPDAGTVFSAVYRVGNGVAGNVGAEAIAHIVVATDGVFSAVRNPLPARGGVEPEPIEAARRDAPEAFRTQERAVTAADYAAAAERRREVQRAAATFRWTGSWTTVFVTADRVGGGAVDAAFEQRLRRHLERFRMAGYDLEVDGPRYVPLDVALHVCVKPGYFRSQVLAAVREVLASTVRPDGTLGLFHPDNFTFAQPAYLSPVIAAVQAVEGVLSVHAETFERLGAPDGVSLEAGRVPIGRLEIAQLANNPNFRERGRLTLNLGGGL